MLDEVDYSQGLPTLGRDPMATPNEAVGYLVSGLLSGGVAAVTIAKHEGWQKGVTIGLLVFFGISSIKMFIDLWRRP